jgi:hypothetical protein
MKKLGLIGALFAFPLLVSAQNTVNSVQDAGAFIIGLINNVAVPVVFALAFIVFIWGVFQVFILGGTNEEAKEKGRALMLWGLIGFFVMVSVWGLVRILTGTVGLTNNVPSYPTAPTSGGPR